MLAKHSPGPDTEDTSGSTPGWAKEGGHDAMVERLKDPELRPKIAADMDMIPAGDLMLTSFENPALRQLTGRTLAENVAIQSQVPVAVFSMEMPGESLAMRMMSSLGRIDQHRVRTGKLEDDEWPRLTSAVSILAEAPLFIDDTPALSPIELRARARRLKREHGGLGLIVIDYLQLMQAPGQGDGLSVVM